MEEEAPVFEPSAPELSSFARSRGFCAACNRDSERLVWRVVDAVERPDLLDGLNAYGAPTCAECGQPGAWEDPLVLTRWSSFAPFLLVVPDGLDELTGAMRSDLDQTLAAVSRAAAEASVLIPPEPVLVVARVMAELSPDVLDELVDRRMTDRSLPEDAGLRTFVLLLEAGLVDHTAWIALGQLIHAETVEALQDLLREDDIWELDEFQRDVLKQADVLGHDLTAEAHAALRALVEAMALPEELPGAWQRYHDALSAAISPERQSELFRVAADEDGDAGERRDAAEEGMRIASSVGDPHWEALFTGIYVTLHREQTRLGPVAQRRMLELQRRALVQGRRGGDLDLQIRLMSDLAGMLMESAPADPITGLTEAVGLLAEIISIATDRGDAAMVTFHRGNLNLAVARLHRLRPTAGLSLEALLGDADAVVEARIRAGGGVDLAYSYAHRGVIRLELAKASGDGRNAEGAVEDFTDAAALAESGDPDLRATVLADLATAEIHLASLRGAAADDPLWQSALQHAGLVATDETVLPASRRGRANLSMAEALLQVDPDRSDVVTHLQEACALMTIEGDPDSLGWAANALGGACKKAERWAEAAKGYEQALDVQNFLEDLDSGGAQLSRPETVTEDDLGPVGRWAAYCLAKAGDYQRAIEILEAARCRLVGRERRAQEATLDLVERMTPGLAREFVERRRALRDCVVDHDRPALRHAVLRTVREIRSAGHPLFLRRQPLSSIGRGLDPAHPLVYLLTTPEGTVGLILSGETQDDITAVWADDLIGSDLAELTFGPGEDSLVGARSPQQIQDGLDRVLPLIGQHLMGQLARKLRDLGARAVTLIPTGALAWWPLHAAPFGADPSSGGLAEESECLWDRMPVGYLPAGIYRIERERLQSRRDTPRMLIGLGDPVGEWKPLPGARMELGAVFEVYQGDAQVVFGTGATRGFLLQHLRNPVEVHLGCHATGTTAERGGAVLHLSDGDLSFEDIDALGGELPIGTVVAAACASGTSDLAVSPDEAMNLASGFLNAGATGVVTSMWQVNDLTTALVMREFAVHTEIAGMDPMEALRAAALWLRGLSADELAGQVRQVAPDTGTRSTEASPARRPRDRRYPFSHPYFWAAMIYTGSSLI
jgi:CHAT domain-containing protein/tetratricopeptide (TPR) repeat protein